MVDNISGHSKLAFTNEPFKVRDESWQSKMLHFKDPEDKLCGFVEANNCVIET